MSGGRRTAPGDGAVHVDDADVGITEARRRLGGVDLGGTFGGLLAGFGATLLLALLAGAAGVVGDGADGISAGEIANAGGVTAVIVLLLACAAAGWAAARIARYDGARNGALAALAFLVVLGAGAIAGGNTVTDTDGLFGTGLVEGISRDDLGAAAAAAAVALLLLGVLVGAAAGRLGGRYHRRADHLVASTRPGAVAIPTVVQRASAPGDTDLSGTARRSRAGAR
jgi:hypothetical protein